MTVSTTTSAGAPRLSSLSGSSASRAPRDAFWPECWGRSYPTCPPCWQATRAIAARAHPHLAITGPGPLTTGGSPGQVPGPGQRAQPAAPHPPQ
jgi:hypothetical protein